MMGLLWCSRVESADLVVPTPDATHGNSLHSTVAADNKPEYPTHSTANQTPAPAKTVPSPRSACASPSLVSFSVEKRSRLTNLSRMAFTGRKLISHWLNQIESEWKTKKDLLFRSFFVEARGIHEHAKTTGFSHCFKTSSDTFPILAWCVR